MSGNFRAQSFVAAILFCVLMSVGFARTNNVATVSIDWSKKIAVSRSVPTLQVVVNPMLRRGSPIHDQAFAALHALGANYVRLALWYPYPKLAVAELSPPKGNKTFWDFSRIDPLVADFVAATRGHPAIFDFCTQPAWMFKADKATPYPSNPDKVDWDYSSAPAALTDPSGMQLRDYYARIASWYTKGGFRDERGRFHKSGHHYNIPYWEIFNEVTYEHKFSPQQYTRIYDAIAGGVRRVDPAAKFVGLALPFPAKPALEYFLDHKNHATGTPLDMVSYHFYATPMPGDTADRWQVSFFSQADQFVSKVKSIEAIRRRLSPATGTAIDEVGTVLPDAGMNPNPAHIPSDYWNLSGAVYAYLYAKLSALGINIVGESQLVGYPTQFPSVTMIDWLTGKPNARYWVLKLLIDNFGPGDTLVLGNVLETAPKPNSNDAHTAIFVQAYRSRFGVRKLLLINKNNRATAISLPRDVIGGQITIVDETTGAKPPLASALTFPALKLKPFAVAVVTWP